MTNKKEPLERAPGKVRVISSRDLLMGHREIMIQHGTEHYRLRLTNSNKLILVK